jgi:RNA polymerase sigma-70 factor (ECF subfamily)
MEARSAEEAAAALLMQRAAAGDANAWGALLVAHQARLCRMVAFRLDPRLRGRLDAADIVQDAFLAAADHREDYFRETGLPLFLWLRGVVANKLLEVHRHHLDAKMRAAGREVAPGSFGKREDEGTHATSGALLHQLSGHATGPKTAAARSERKTRLRSAVDGMDPTDREVLALRHYEQLTNAEAAAALGIAEAAAAKRYVRALRRVKAILSEMPGGLTEMRP